MGTHSWSVPPLGLLALFSAAPQVSPPLRPQCIFPNFHFLGVWALIPELSPHLVCWHFSLPRLKYPPTPPAVHFPEFPFSRSFQSIFPPPPSFCVFPGVSPQSARTPFSDFSWSIPPLRPAVIFPVSWSIPPLRPPSVSQLPGVSPHSAHRDFPSFLEYPPTSPALHVPKVSWSVPPHNSASALHALCSTHESQFCKRSTRSGALRSHTS